MRMRLTRDLLLESMRIPGVCVAYRGSNKQVSTTNNLYDNPLPSLPSRDNYYAIIALYSNMSDSTTNVEEIVLEKGSTGIWLCVLVNT